MDRLFYIVGPTATGKSEIAAAAAAACGAEVLNADAYQIYRGLDLLTAKPNRATLAKAPHHLLSTIPLTEEMNAETFRRLASDAIAESHGRAAPMIVVGGSGLYIRALAGGLSTLPPADTRMREKLATRSLDELNERLALLDPESAATIDPRNRRRVQRALEICVATGQPASRQRKRARSASPRCGVLLVRDRTELHDRINRRVVQMFADGVVREVRAAGRMSVMAAKTLGLAFIQRLIAGEMTEAECIAAIQQATRRYAKRQLTWFRHQTNLETLNLSVHGSSEAIEWITRQARLSFARRDDRN